MTNSFKSPVIRWWMSNIFPLFPTLGGTAEPLPKYEFTPVPTRSTRHDGWTPELQRRFVGALSAMGSPFPAPSKSYIVTKLVRSPSWIASASPTPRRI